MNDSSHQTNQKSNIIVAQALKNVLADAFILTIKTRHYHWNVTGPTFLTLHGLFNEIYDMLDEAGDDFAERIRALDLFTHGSYAEFIKVSTIKEETKIPSHIEMIQNLTCDLENFSSRLNEAKKVALSVEDDGTADLMVEYIRSTNKFTWMLRSHLEKR